MNGSWRTALHHRVARRCGDPGRLFSAYGHTFGDWVDAPAGRRQPAFATVEAGVAGYLQVAARTGRRWGTAAGLVVGVAAALVAFLVVRLVA